MRESEEVAELGQEEILVGALGTFAVGPASDELGDGIGGHAGRRERECSGSENVWRKAKGKFGGGADGKSRTCQARVSCNFSWVAGFSSA